MRLSGSVRFCRFAVMDSNRLKKVNRLLQQDLAEVLRGIAQQHFKGVLITVSIVKVTPDLGLARIALSVFPATSQDEIMKWIREQKGYIKDQLVHRLKGQLRVMPDLEFFLDDSLDYRDNIDRLLRGEGESPIN